MSLNTYLDNIVESKISNNKFYVRNVSDNLGNKLIINELPNSGRIIQFFGEDESIFSIEGTIEAELFETFKANILIQQTQYLSFFDKLNIPVIIAKITPSYSISNLGLIDFTITAYTSEISTSIYKQDDNQNLNDIVKKIDETALTKMTNFYKKTQFAIQTASATINSALGSIEEITLTINSVRENVELLNNQISSIKSTINGLISAPSLLANSFSNLISNFSNTFTNLDLNLKSTLLLSNSIAPEPTISTSQYEQEITQLANVFNSFLLTSCISSYSRLIQQKQFIYEYQITDEIKNINQLYDISKNISDNELKNSIFTNLFTLIDYVNTKAKTTKQKQTITIEYTTSLQLLCFAIYGNIDNLSEFQNWNYEIYQKGNIATQGDKITYYQ